MVGTVVGHYKLLSPLGRGAMGEVYLGEDVRLGRRVAVKVLPAEACCDPASIERFVREAQIVSNLNHPNICTLHDIGQHDGRQFMVMELLEGETLAARIAKGPLPIDEIVTLGADIASALDAAHRQGVVHRDIKPANLFVTASGLKVLDFGVAKLSDAAAATDTTRGGSDPLTMLGGAVGTMAYMSPEQARGEAIDARSDLFSLGIVLYEMAVGRPPFTGATAAVVFEGLLTKTPPPPSARRAGVPEGFDRLVMRALEKSPDARHPSAGAVRADLLALRTGSVPPPVSAVAHPPSPPPGPPAGVRSSGPRRWWWLAAPLATAAVVAGVVAWQSASTPALQSKDPVVLADLTNRTGDAMFDDTLGEALAVQLRQSPFLNLIPDGRVRAALRMMERPADTRLDVDTGREVCQRVGAKAVLTSAIASLGSDYVITLRALDCVSGDVLAEQQAQAANKETVLEQLGVAARVFREQLGESLSSINRYDVKIQQATTSSLEALKAYSQALSTRRTGGDGAALPFFRRAVELDPEFARAHAALGTAYANQRDLDNARKHTERAYALRDKVSELERLYIEARYHTTVTRDTAKAIEAYRVTLATYPNDYTALANLGVLYKSQGDLTQAVEVLQKAVAVSPEEPTARVNLAATLLDAGRIDEARREAEPAVALRDDAPARNLLMAIALFSGDSALEQAQRDWARSAADPRTALPVLFSAAAYRGQWSDVERLLGDIEQAYAGANSRQVVAQFRALAGISAALLGDTARAKALAQKLDRDHPVDVLADQRLVLAAVLGDRAMAARSLPLALKQLPAEDTDDVRAYRALALMASRQWAQAADALGVVSLSPGHTEQVLMRGLIAAELGRFDDARADFEWVRDHGRRELSADAGIVRLRIAQCFEGAGRRDEARRAYQDFLGFWKTADANLPAIVEAKRALARLGS